MSGFGDLKLAARGLRRSPGFTLVVVATLALGVGLNTALFSVVNTVLLQPLDYADAGSLVHLSAELPAKELVDVSVSGGDMRDLREAAVLERLEGVTSIRQNLNGAGLPRQVEVGWASNGFLDMLGVVPVLGRLHAEGDPAGQVVLSHPIWRDAFGLDSDAVGRTVRLDGYPYEVIGVLPEDFRLRMPNRNGGSSAVPEVWKNPDAFWQNGDIWSAQGPQFGLLQLVGRLGEGQTLESAQAAIDAVVLDLRSRFPQFEQDGLRIRAAGLQDRVVEGIRPTLALLLGAVVMVLLIACANVANLLLVRGQSRSREIAVRMALGSPRARVGRFLFMESLVLAVGGAAAGLLLAAWAIAAIPAFAPPGFPLVDAIGLDGSVLGFALGVAVLVTLVVGALPGIVALRTDPGTELSHGRPAGGTGGRIRDGLVVAQVALSIVLLVGAGLLVQSLVRMQRVDSGFDPRGVYTFGVSIPGAQYGWPQEADRFYREVEARVAALPGVESAGVVWPMPFAGTWSGEHAKIEGEVVRLGLVDYRLATEAYFPAAGIPLVDGRHFREGDEAYVVQVSASVAERTWPGQSPIGRVVQADPWGRGLEDFTVVGVVGDVRDRDLREAPAGAIYFDSRSWSWVDWEVHVVARTDRTPASLLPDIRAAVAEIDAEVPVAHPAPMAEAVRAQSASARFVMTLLGAFATAAALLALVGLYGVISYSVGLRSREFGVRIAVGSARAGIQRLVVGRGLTLAVLGLGIGLVGARTLVGLLEAFLFDVTATDLPTYAGVALLLGAGAILASWLPAWRASRLDPVQVLRSD